MLTRREINEFSVYSMDNGKASLHLIVHPVTNRYELIVSDCIVINSFVAAVGSMATVVDYNRSQVIIKQMEVELNKGVQTGRRNGFELDGFDKLKLSLEAVNPIKISNKNRLSDIINQFKSENLNK